MLRWFSCLVFVFTVSASSFAQGAQFLFSKLEEHIVVRDFFSDFLAAYKEPFSPLDTTPTIYFTFDDGPDKGSAVVAEVAYEERIPISFFMVGMHYQEVSPAILKQYKKLVMSPFIEVYNHSFSHGFRNQFLKYYNDVNGAFEDIIKNESIYQHTHKIVRLPGSNVWFTPLVYRPYSYAKIMTLSEKLAANGFYVFGWDNEWRFDYKTLHLHHSADQMFHSIHQQVLSNKTVMKNHLVLLMHERSFRTRESQGELRRLIYLLKRQGYRFAFSVNHPALYKPH